MAKRGLSRLAKAIVETADGMNRTGVLGDDAHTKITLRHLGKPTGAAPALLDVIRRKGIKVVP